MSKSSMSIIDLQVYCKCFVVIQLSYQKPLSDTNIKIIHSFDWCSISVISYKVGHMLTQKSQCYSSDEYLWFWMSQSLSNHMFS